MTILTRDQLEWKVTQAVMAGVPIFFGEGELELEPWIESDGYPSPGTQYQGMNLDEVFAHKATFCTADLEGSRMRRTKLVGSDFSLARVSRVDFMSADLRETNWASQVMTGAIFYEADMSKAVFCGNEVRFCTFEGANLVGTSMGYGDEFRLCSFHRGSLAGADADCVTFRQCDFSQVTMRGATFKSCRFMNCSFVGADLREASFDEHTVFYDVEFRDTQYTQGQFDILQFCDTVNGDRLYSAYRRSETEHMIEGGYE